MITKANTLKEKNHKNMKNMNEEKKEKINSCHGEVLHKDGETQDV